MEFRFLCLRMLRLGPNAAANSEQLLLLSTEPLLFQAHAR